MTVVKRFVRTSLLVAGMVGSVSGRDRSRRITSHVPGSQARSVP